MYEARFHDTETNAPRVYGTGKTKKAAETMARWELMEYIKEHRTRWPRGEAHFRLEVEPCRG
jgi:hypothetical protein